MNDLQNYEKLIPQKNTGKAKLKPMLFLCLYALWVALGTVLTILAEFNVALLLLTLLTTWGWIWLTWPLTQIEWEYTLAAGTLYVAKIYGRKKRKEIIEVELSDALMIAPANEDNQRKAEELSPSATVRALSEPSAENIWLLLFEDAPNHRVLVYAEMDEEMLRILRHGNPRVTSREKLTLPKDSEEK